MYLYISTQVTHCNFTLIHPKVYINKNLSYSTSGEDCNIISAERKISVNIFDNCLFLVSDFQHPCKSTITRETSDLSPSELMPSSIKVFWFTIITENQVFPFSLHLQSYRSQICSLSQDRFLLPSQLSTLYYLLIPCNCVLLANSTNMLLAGFLGKRIKHDQL